MCVELCGSLFGQRPQRKASDEARGARFSLLPCQFNKNLSDLNEA